MWYLSLPQSQIAAATTDFHPTAEYAGDCLGN